MYFYVRNRRRSSICIFAVEVDLRAPQKNKKEPAGWTSTCVFTIELHMAILNVKTHIETHISIRAIKHEGKLLFVTFPGPSEVWIRTHSLSVYSKMARFILHAKMEPEHTFAQCRVCAAIAIQSAHLTTPKVMMISLKIMECLLSLYKTAARDRP